jgi:hypothetical protein
MFELQLLGAIPAHPTTATTAVTDGADVGGEYDPATGRVLLITEPNESEALLEDTLAHELLHALEAQNFPTLRPLATSDPRYAAEKALIEGSATVVQYDYAERYLHQRQSLASYLHERVVGVPAGARFLSDEEMFPYVEGAEFVNALVSRDHGWSLVDNADVHPPTSEQQILQPRLFLSRRRSPALGFNDRAVLDHAGWKLTDSETMDAFDTAALLAPGMQPGLHPAAAAGWQGGQLQLWQQPAAGGKCATFCARTSAEVIVWKWSSTGDLDRASSELRGYLGTALHVATPARGGGTSTGSYAAVADRGRQATLALAPTASLARRLARTTVARPRADAAGGG